MGIVAITLMAYAEILPQSPHANYTYLMPHQNLIEERGLGPSLENCMSYSLTRSLQCRQYRPWKKTNIIFEG
jgi:hypothetical protein